MSLEVGFLSALIELFESDDLILLFKPIGLWMGVILPASSSTWGRGDKVSTVITHEPASGNEWKREYDIFHRDMFDWKL